jgi:hypothetical protein
MPATTSLKLPEALKGQSAHSLMKETPQHNAVYGGSETRAYLLARISGDRAAVARPLLSPLDVTKPKPGFTHRLKCAGLSGRRSPCSDYIACSG